MTLKACLASLAFLLISVPSKAHETHIPSTEGRISSEPGDVALWYRVAGQHSKHPILVLHGGPGQGSQTFQASVGPQIENFATVIYYDQRGSGRSERPSDLSLYSMPILISDIEALLDHLGIERAILLGHSFGSILALEYASSAPERVAGLILTGAVPDMPAALQALCDRLEIEDPAAFQRARSGASDGGTCQPFAAYDDESRAQWIEAAMFPKPENARRVEEWDNANGLGNSGELGNALWSQGLLEYRFASPERLSMPVLFIDGALDHQTAIEPQVALASSISDGSVISYDNAGHFTFVDEPDRFALDVRNFIERISAAHHAGQGK